MGFKEFLLLKHLRFGIFTFTGFIAFLLGLITWASLFPSQSFEATRAPASIKKRSSILVEKGFSTNLSDQAMQDLGAMTIDVNCSERMQKQPLKIKAKSLRLRTKGCDLERVLNHRNGFEATLFETSEGKFTSDYISLAQGDNPLRLEGINSSGENVLIEFTIQYQ